MYLLIVRVADFHSYRQCCTTYRRHQFPQAQARCEPSLAAVRPNRARKQGVPRSTPQAHLRADASCPATLVHSST